VRSFDHGHGTMSEQTAHPGGRDKIVKLTAIRVLTLILAAGWGTLVLAAQQAPIKSPHTASPNTARNAGEVRLVLDANVTILESPNAPAPIQRAAEDLATDFGKALGKKPRIVRHEEDAGPVTILIGEQLKLPEAMRDAALTAPESFSISVTTANWNKTRTNKVVLLSGADIRGTIYAVYEFSEKFLGIDPLYYWTDRLPARRTSIGIPASYEKTFPAPVFKYRGFFINDEDLLTGWAPGEKKIKRESRLPCGTKFTRRSSDSRETWWLREPGFFLTIRRSNSHPNAD